MNELINSIVESLSNFIVSVGPIAGFVFVVIESIVPILPLAIFIALNMLAFGNVFGFLLSWVATILGCTLAFLLVRKGFSGYFESKIKDKKKFKKVINSINKISFPQLTILTAMPFTPAFLINVACGISNMSFKKFLISILLAKLSIVYFWGYIGTSLIESIKRPTILLEVSCILVIFYLISTVINKKLKIK